MFFDDSDEYDSDYEESPDEKNDRLANELETSVELYDIQRFAEIFHEVDDWRSFSWSFALHRVLRAARQCDPQMEPFAEVMLSWQPIAETLVLYQPYTIVIFAKAYPDNETIQTALAHTGIQELPPTIEDIIREMDRCYIR